jgi:hypothetical protein
VPGPQQQFASPRGADDAPVAGCRQDFAFLGERRLLAGVPQPVQGRALRQAV